MWFDYKHTVDSETEEIQLHYVYEYCGGSATLTFISLEKAHNHLNMIHHKEIQHPGRWAISVIDKDTHEIKRRLQSFDWKYGGYTEYEEHKE